MEHVGIDVHKKHSQICLQHEDGTLHETRVPTTRDGLGSVFDGRARCKILVESSMVVEWVARYLEELGHELIVADPNFAPMYATLNKKVKTDRRDARALLDACRQGTYRPAHRCSDEQRAVRWLHGARELLVAQRTELMTLTLARLTAHGIVPRTGETKSFEERVGDADVPRDLQEHIEPFLAVIARLNAQISALDEQVVGLHVKDANVKRLMSVPSIGALTASCFVAALDDVARFTDAHQAEAYLGLVPFVSTSGETKKGYRPGAITKAGNRYARVLLVQWAWRIMRSKDERVAPLRKWAEAIARRRGRTVAAVALARKGAGILFAMWRDKKEYDVEAIKSRRRTYNLVSTRLTSEAPAQ